MITSHNNPANLGHEGVISDCLIELLTAVFRSLTEFLVPSLHLTHLLGDCNRSGLLRIYTDITSR